MHHTQDSRDFAADIITLRHVPGSESQINHQRIHDRCNIFNAEIPGEEQEKKMCIQVMRE